MCKSKRNVETRELHLKEGEITMRDAFTVGLTAAAQYYQDTGDEPIIKGKITTDGKVYKVTAEYAVEEIDI